MNLDKQQHQKHVKFKNVELLRFILAWVIVMYHMVHIPSLRKAFNIEEIWPCFQFGATSVECFFIIAFFFLTLKTKKDYSIRQFVVDKWFRLSPPILVVTTACYIFHLLGFWNWNCSANIEMVLLIRNWVSEPEVGAHVSQAWYCCIFFGLSIFYLGLIKTIHTNYIPIIIGILTYIGLRFMVVPGFSNILGGSVVNGGVNRALFCMGIGYFLAYAYTHPVGSSPLCSLQKHKIITSFVECLCLILFLRYIVCGVPQPLSKILAILTFAMIFWFFIQQKGWISSFLEKNWCTILGRYAYSIFIVHMFVRQLAIAILFPAHKEWCEMYPWLVLSGILSITMLLAIILYHFVEAPISRYMKYLKQQFSNQSSETSL